MERLEEVRWRERVAEVEVGEAGEVIGADLVWACGREAAEESWPWSGRMEICRAKKSSMRERQSCFEGPSERKGR
jgi:hypothetical protein